MKKIMFNDKYGLTRAVLEGRKTQTRRMLNPTMLFQRLKTYEGWSNEEIRAWKRSCKRRLYEAKGDMLQQMLDYALSSSHYKVGEVVAIAQKYSELEYGVDWVRRSINKEHAGWNNKIFVSAEEMPHRIKITNVRLERLQDISDEDCLKEGVYYHTEPPKHHEYDRYSPWSPSVKPYKFESEKHFCSAKYAFKHLIEKVSGKGTWESNAWIFVYDFELVK